MSTPSLTHGESGGQFEGAVRRYRGCVIAHHEFPRHARRALQCVQKPSARFVGQRRLNSAMNNTGIPFQFGARCPLGAQRLALHPE